MPDTASNNNKISFRKGVSPMSTSLIPLSQNIVNIQSELNSIGANARGLKPAGKDLLPLKPEMLDLPPAETAIVMQAVELLFAAVLQYVDGQIRETQASNFISSKYPWQRSDALDIVAARIDRGTADATIHALLYGPTALLLATACEQAPIAMHAILHISPDLCLRDRLQQSLYLKYDR